MSKQPTIHQANDGIMQDTTLSPTERVVVYHTIHRANGSAKFWWGARRTATHLGCDRRTVKSAWKKMEERGWMTGEVVSGRSTTWSINRQGVVEYYTSVVHKSTGVVDISTGGGCEMDPNTLNKTPKEDAQLILSKNSQTFSEGKRSDRIFGSGKKKILPSYLSVRDQLREEPKRMSDLPKPEHPPLTDGEFDEFMLTGELHATG